MLKVHITGVTGLIGGLVYDHLVSLPGFDVSGSDRQRERSRRVKDGRSLEIPENRFRRVDIARLSNVIDAVNGADVVVHLAAIPGPDDDFDAIVSTNLVGAYNVYEACRRQGVRRVVAASSIMVNWGHFHGEAYRSVRDATDETRAQIRLVHPDDPPAPEDTYAASKIFSESLGRMYSSVHGMSCLCLRFGWVGYGLPSRPQGASIWCSHRDVAACVRAAVEAEPGVRFGIFFVVSDNRHRWVDLGPNRERLHWQPVDSSEDHLATSAPNS